MKEIFLLRIRHETRQITLGTRWFSEKNIEAMKSFIIVYYTTGFQFLHPSGVVYTRINNVTFLPFEIQRE